MAIPDYESLMRPLLEQVRDGREYHIAAVRVELARALQLDADELAQMVPSGKVNVFASRVNWARTYLYKAGAVASARRGYIQITDRGLEVLESGIPRVTWKYLLRFPEFSEWLATSRKTAVQPAPVATERVDVVSSEESPEELIETSFRQLRSSVEDELLVEVCQLDPTAFEQLVIELLLRLGYGGVEGEGTHVGRSGDGGIDGVIHQDALGLERVYIQAKRWQNPVGRPEIMAFAGSLVGQQASKGVFITTSLFTSAARNFVEGIDKRIVLIDGPALVRMMYDRNLGVATRRTYEVKRLDTDYFTPAE